METMMRGKQGERPLGRGNESELRLGKLSELIVNDSGLGRFFEAAFSGRVFYTYQQALTIAATHNSPLAAATATPIVGIANPPSSNRLAVVLSGFISHVSGTPAGGQAVWNAAKSSGVLSVNPTGSIVPGFIGGAGSIMRCVNNIALTGLDITTGNLTAVRPFGGAAFAGALAANHDAGWLDQVDGALIVPPGALLGVFAGTGAGTSWVVNAGMMWAELELA